MNKIKQYLQNPKVCVTLCVIALLDLAYCVEGQECIHLVQHLMGFFKHLI